MKNGNISSRTSLAMLWVGIASLLHAQAPVSKPAQFAPLPSYVGQGLVPSQVREHLLVLGDRIQKPGKERSTLVGTFTDKNGTGSAQLVWEVPGRLRFDRSSGPSNPLIVDSASGAMNGASMAQSDLGILESVFDDSAEMFLYGFLQGHAHRFLGARFRTDDGRTANYRGPLYDIYETVAPVRAAGGPQRQKFYYFDSQTKLLTKTRYVILRGSTQLPVSTEFGNWITSGGQAFPGQIVRKENDVAVFTFIVSSASAGPTPNDGLFPKH